MDTTRPYRLLRSLLSQVEISPRWLCVALLLATLPAWYATSRCQAPPQEGTLSADRETMTWQSGADTLRGRYDDPAELQKTLGAFKRVFLPDGLRIDGVIVPPKNIKLTVSEMSSERVSITFRQDTLPPTGELQWSSGQLMVVAAGSAWLGNVVTFDAGVTIDGEVIGDVIAVGGDVTVSETATVRGDVIVLGGVLRQRGDAKIYGRILAPVGHRRPRVSISRAWEFEDKRIQWEPSVSYDRVDGLRVGSGLIFQKSALTPRLELWGGYAFASKTGQFRMDLRQRLFERTDIQIGGAIFQLTQTDDDSTVGRDENTLFAVLAGSDYRDYYSGDGGELFARYKYRERGILSLLYRNVDYHWMDAHQNLWHLFRPNHEFRSNFSTLPEEMLTNSLNGRSSSIAIMLKISPIENGGHPIGFNGSVDLSLEVAGGLLGGDYNYERATADGHGWWDSGRWHQVMLRAFYGTSRHGMPPNKLFYLGGLGTLRGYPQKSLFGDEVFLGQIEYTFNYWENKMGKAGAVLFGDVGRASSDRHFFDLRSIKADVGLGLRFGKALRIDAAKGLDSAKRNIRVSVQVSRPL